MSHCFSASHNRPVCRYLSTATACLQLTSSWRDQRFQHGGSDRSPRWTKPSARGGELAACSTTGRDATAAQSTRYLHQDRRQPPDPVDAQTSDCDLLVCA